MFSIARTPLASPVIKHGFTHARAFPFHLPPIPSPGFGAPMQMTPLLSPAMLVPAAHVLPNFNNNLPSSPMAATPMSPAMFIPAAHVLPGSSIDRPRVGRQFTMPAYPFPTVLPEQAGTSPKFKEVKARPPRRPVGLSKVISGKIVKDSKPSSLKSKSSRRGVLNLTMDPVPVVINEDDLLADALRLATIEENEGIKFGGFQSIHERTPTPFPATQKGGYLHELDYIDLWI